MLLLADPRGKALFADPSPDPGDNPGPTGFCKLWTKIQIHKKKNSSDEKQQSVSMYLVLASKSSERVEAESIDDLPGLETEEDLVWLFDLSDERVRELDAGRLLVV